MRRMMVAFGLLRLGEEGGEEGEVCAVHDAFILTFGQVCKEVAGWLHLVGFVVGVFLLNALFQGKAGCLGGFLVG